MRTSKCLFSCFFTRDNSNTTRLNLDIHKISSEKTPIISQLQFRLKMLHQTKIRYFPNLQHKVDF